MAENFYTILTKTGMAKIANAHVLGTKVNFTTLAVGDGGGSHYKPTDSQTALKNEVWRGNINNVRADEENPSWIIVEIVIPTTVGGFTIREAGIFDADGDMIAIARQPETYKPLLSEGSSKDLLVKTILEVTNTSSVTMKIDPTVILATRKDIDILSNSIKTIDQNVNLQLDYIKSRIDNLNTNDKQAREEIIDIKRELAEKEIIDFIDKSSGIGYFDTFTDTEGVDLANTSATVNNLQCEVNFRSQGSYNITALESSTGTTIKTLERPEVGDYVKDTHEVLNVVDSSTEQVLNKNTLVDEGSFNLRGNSGRKTVMLDNGYIFMVYLEGSGGFPRCKISKDNGETFESVDLNVSLSDFMDLSVCYIGNTVYFGGYQKNGRVMALSYDTDTSIVSQSLDRLVGVVASSYNVQSSVSIESSRDGSSIHLCWSGISAGVTNSYNIHYVKGVIQPDGQVLWGLVVYLTKDNVTNTSNTYPSIVMDWKDHPLIVFVKNTGTSAYSLRRYGLQSDGVTWIENIILNGLVDYQRNVSAIYLPPRLSGTEKGRILVTWVGRDSIDSTQGNVRACYSDDGVTWSGQRKLTSGNVFTRQQPNITCNSSGMVSILYFQNEGGNNYKVNKISFSGEFDNLTETTILATEDGINPTFASPLYRPDLDFDLPLSSQTFGGAYIKFLGSWKTGSISYNSTLNSPITVVKDEILPVISRSGDVLKMLPQNFLDYKDISLRLHHDKINYLTVAETNDGSNTFKVSTSTRPIEVGDKIFYQDSENQIVNVEDDGMGVTLENSISVTEGQTLLLSDFHVSNNNTEMNLRKINADNYEFELNNASSNKTDLRIFGKDNKINSLAYAIS